MKIEFDPQKSSDKTDRKGFSVRAANAYFAEKTNPTLMIGEITRVQLGDGGFK